MFNSHTKPANAQPAQACRLTRAGLVQPANKTVLKAIFTISFCPHFYLVITACYLIFSPSLKLGTLHEE
jgi:hypothetical protein